MKRYHLAVEPDEQEEIDHAIERYFADHLEQNPERVSVVLRAVDDGTYEALGHTVVGTGAPIEQPVEKPVDIPLELLAEDAFIAYANRLSHANHTMDVAEGWANQGDEIRAGFTAAAQAIRDRVLGAPTPTVAPGLAHLEEGQ